MKRAAVFFDRDNTLIVSDGYLGNPSEVVLVEGAADAVARARALGYATVVVSNQSGVARGMFDEAAVRAVNARLDELLQAANPGAIIDRHEFCPFHPDGTVEAFRQESPLRKPKPGMILAAAEAMALDLARSWVVGDAGRDIEAGKAAGCRTIWFRDAALAASPAAKDGVASRPHYTVATLKDALDVIQKNPNRAPVVAAVPPKVAVAASAIPQAKAGGSVAGMVLGGAMGGAGQAAAAPAKAATAPMAQQSPRAVAPTNVGAKVAVAATNAAPVNAAPASKPAASPTGQAGAPPVTASSAPAAPPASAAPAAPPAPAAPGAPGRMEAIAEQILVELRRRNEQGVTDFSVSKLLAGVTQILVLATMFLGYVRGTSQSLQIYLMVALILQTMTIALLIMSRQR